MSQGGQHTRMNYSEAVIHGEQMKQFLAFQQFQRMSAAAAAHTPLLIPPPPKHKYQQYVEEKKAKYSKPFDASAFVTKALQNLYMTKSEENAVGATLLNTIKVVCRLDPSRLSVIGGVHTNDEGTKAYITAAVRINADDEKAPFFINIHLYGSFRNNFFTVKSVGVFPQWSGEEVVVYVEPPLPREEKGYIYGEE